MRVSTKHSNIKRFTALLAFLHLLGAERHYTCPLGFWREGHHPDKVPFAEVSHDPEVLYPMPLLMPHKHPLLPAAVWSIATSSF